MIIKKRTNDPKESSVGKGTLAEMNLDKKPRDLHKITGSDKDKGTLGKMDEIDYRTSNFPDLNNEVAFIYRP